MKVGDKFRLLTDQHDCDEDDNERTTPAGSVVEIDEVLTNSRGHEYYSTVCHETGGWFFFEPDELLDETEPLQPV